MAPTMHVKTRLLLAAALLLVAPLRAEEPDAKALLQSVRVAQGSQNQNLSGRLRTGPKSIPFKLTVASGVVRWDFAEPPQILQLRMGDQGATLEEVGKGGAQKVSPARFDQKVQGSDITYEDLSMRFLYWPTATVIGEQTMLLTKCAIVQVEPPAKNDSQYTRVKLWIARNTGALMQAEAYGADGKIARRFKVVSGQNLGDGLWILKEMRIESMGMGRSVDRTPSYLEIEKPGS